jgi:hypothetical protein
MEKSQTRSQKRQADVGRIPRWSGRMTAEQRDRLTRLINDPPPGSKLAAAKEYGIDLTLLVRTLGLTPTERLEELQGAQTFIQELRRAVRRT